MYIHAFIFLFFSRDWCCWYCHAIVIIIMWASLPAQGKFLRCSTVQLSSYIRHIGERNIDIFYVLLLPCNFSSSTIKECECWVLYKWRWCVSSPYKQYLIGGGGKKNGVVRLAWIVCGEGFHVILLYFTLFFLTWSSVIFLYGIPILVEICRFPMHPLHAVVGIMYIFFIRHGNACNLSFDEEGNIT